MKGDRHVCRRRFERVAPQFRRTEADDRPKGALANRPQGGRHDRREFTLRSPPPTVHATDLSVWRLLWKITRSTLSIWPDYAFDKLYNRNRVLGVETITISDPEGVRHVLTANAGNYRRPYSVTRIARHLSVQGFFSQKAPIGVRQRRLLAPTFTPATIGLLLN